MCLCDASRKCAVRQPPENLQVPGKQELPEISVPATAAGVPPAPASTKEHPLHNQSPSSRRVHDLAEVRAGIYARISHVLDDDKTKVADQLRLGHEVAAGHGWRVVATYEDNNRSAWQRNRKRPGWDQLLADVEAGRINCIIVYHGDRLIRQPWDLELLLKLARDRGIRLVSLSGSRDLSSPDDQFILRIEAAQACKSSDDTSRRLKSHHERRRRAGRRATGGHGGRTFGYESDGVTHRAADRCAVATRLEESEPDVIREMARRILAGESRTSVGATLTARGWRTPAGNALTYDRVRKILLRPDLTGLMPDGETAGGWEPILDRETWEQVQLALQAGTTVAPTFGVTPARRWLGSGLYLCDPCGTPMRVRPHGNRARDGWAAGYACENHGACGKTYRDAAALDAYVIGCACGRLANEENPAPDAPARPEAGKRWAELAIERAEAEALLADASRSKGRATLLMERLDGIDAQMEALREQESVTEAQRLRRQYAGISPGEFRELPLTVQRALVAATVTVRVLPASRRGRGFRSEDVQVRPVELHCAFTAASTRRGPWTRAR